VKLLNLKRIIKGSFYLFLAFVLTVAVWPRFASAKDNIHILYDSETRNPELQVGWGFAALIKRGDKKILVDTGWHENIFRHNLKKLGCTPRDIDYVIISHWHPDHSGGLKYLFSGNPAIVAYVPADFNRNKYPAEWKLNTVAGHYKIAEDIYIVRTNPKSSRFGIKEELSLAVKTNRGAVIVSGCFHTGWPELIKAVRPLMQDKAYLMVGGGRFIDLTEGELIQLAEELSGLGLQNVGLTHCAAGLLPNRVFDKYYGKHSIYARLGAVIPIPD
jgi:7,8-dihydropterin-6-yl-methyl-4-(beta-D-ribofuranosyl)aminobenzene 5'-phosphate synthase